MMKYPLQEIQEIKKKRLEEAEKILAEKKRLLEAEEKKLKEAEEKRDQVKRHRYEKIRKYLAELEGGTSSDSIARHESYIKKVVDEELRLEEKKVEEQKRVVKRCEEEVEKARLSRLKRQQDVEKLDLHHQEWSKEVMLEMVKKETEESDELGSSTYTEKQKKRPHPFKKKT